MSIATLTSKGQVTIPADVREALCLHSGDRIDFVVDSSGGATVRPLKKTVDEVFGMLHQPGQKSASIANMREAIAKHIRKKFG